MAQALSHLPKDWPSTPPAADGKPQAAPNEVSKAYDTLSETPDNVLLSDEVAETLRGAMEAHPDAVAIARTVAFFDRGRHELQPGPTLVDTPLPETQATRTAARLLTADAAIRDHFGDPDGALESCRAILEVGRSIGDEPFLISQLVRIAIGGVAMQSSRRVMAQGEPSDEALARLQDLILDESGQPLLLHALRGERAILFEVIRRLATNEIEISALAGGNPKPVLRERKRAIAPWGRIMYENQMALGLEWMNQAVDIARQPPSARPPLVRQLEAEVDRVRRSWLAHFNTATLPILMVPALTTSYTAQSRYLAELGATAILIAAERHRLETGSWPASIESIDPEILPDPPVDPFSGRPFRLLHEDGQFVIYSVGANGRDERGDYAPKEWRTGKHDDVGARGWDILLRRLPPQPPEGPVQGGLTGRGQAPRRLGASPHPVSRSNRPRPPLDPPSPGDLSMPRIPIQDLDDPRVAHYRHLKPTNRTRRAGVFVVEGETLVQPPARQRVPHGLGPVNRAIRAPDRLEAPRGHPPAGRPGRPDRGPDRLPLPPGGPGLREAPRLARTGLDPPGPRSREPPWWSARPWTSPTTWARSSGSATPSGSTPSWWAGRAPIPSRAG